MAIQISSDPRPDHLKLTAVGPWGSEPFGVTTERFLAECEKHQATKVFFDFTRLVGNPNTLERFSMATIFAAHYMKARVSKRIPPCRFAVLGKEPLVDPQRFEETVARNRGLMVRTFIDPLDAYRWLGARPSEGLPPSGD